MASTYTIANYISSFGFTEIWRRQCIGQLSRSELSESGLDLMSGMGENWRFLLHIRPNSKIKGIDISEKMNREAAIRKENNKWKNIQLQPCNVFKNGLTGNSQDFIVSTFGLKTFSKNQQADLAKEIARLLKPKGVFSFIEISFPSNKIMRNLLSWYLHRIIPWIGKRFLHNETSYRMLGVYTSEFENSKHFYNCLQAEGLHVNYKQYFFGCGSGVVGHK